MKRIVALIVGVKIGLLVISLVIEKPVEVVEAYEDPRPIVELMTTSEYKEYVEERDSEPILIEVKVDYSFTDDEVKEEIQKVFPDAPIMEKVAWCESRFDESAFNPINNSNDTGVMQISKKYHGERAERMGFDLEYLPDNLTFARILYDEQGLAPWIWSKPCWNK